MIRLLQNISLNECGTLRVGDVCTLSPVLEAALVRQGLADRVSETRQAPYQQAVVSAPQRKRRGSEVAA